MLAGVTLYATTSTIAAMIAGHVAARVHDDKASAASRRWFIARVATVTFVAWPVVVVLAMV